jgi:cytochrome c biogenesis protein CcmG/thiol:disulfide interchange protein DsbE
MKKPSISIKISTIALIITLTLVYSIYSKKSIDSLLTSADDLILKNMPSFNHIIFNQEKKINKESLIGNGRLAFVHFWATWCAPCEAEFPDFLKLVKKYEDKGVMALIVAVQDDEAKMAKYLKRFKDLPANIILVHDKTGELMASFGTVKIPETYLFGRDYSNLNKYVGPQDWLQKRFSDRVDFYLNNLKIESESSKKYPIKTH